MITDHILDYIMPVLLLTGFFVWIMIIGLVIYYIYTELTHDRH